MWIFLCVWNYFAHKQKFPVIKLTCVIHAIPKKKILSYILTFWLQSQWRKMPTQREFTFQKINGTSLFDHKFP